MRVSGLRQTVLPQTQPATASERKASTVVATCCSAAVIDSSICTLAIVHIRSIAEQAWPVHSLPLPPSSVILHVCFTDESGHASFHTKAAVEKGHEQTICMRVSWLPLYVLLQETSKAASAHQTTLVRASSHLEWRLHG